MITNRIAWRPAAVAAALAVVAAVAVGACSSGGPNPSAVASILASASLPRRRHDRAHIAPPEATDNGAPGLSAAEGGPDGGRRAN